MSTLQALLDNSSNDQYGTQLEQIAAKYGIRWKTPSFINGCIDVDDTRAFHNAAPPNADPFTSVHDLIHFQSRIDRSSNEHICVIENPSLEWIAALGTAWDIDPLHFVYYLRNDGDYPRWASTLEREEQQALQLRACTMRGHFVSESKLVNVNHVHRIDTRHAERGIYGTMYRMRSCMSFVALDRLLLILVDATPKITETCGSPGILFGTLSTPHPNGHVAWHFLCGPPYHDNSLAGAIFEYCQGKDQRDLLRLWHRHGARHRKDLMLMALMTFSWRRCLENIALVIAQVSFGQIRTINSDNLTEYNDQLHSLREDLSRLKQVIPTDQNLFCTDPSCAHNGDIAQHYSNYKVERTAHWTSSEGWPLLKAEVQRQEDILVQTFQILHSTIAIKESQANVEIARYMAEEQRRSAQQARRGQLLTYLAFIYAPLSFVTSIYGMNIKEVNDSPLSVWVCFVALAVVMVGTLMIWLAFKAWERWLLDNRGERDKEKDPGKMA